MALKSISIIGGCGHVGFPLGLALAQAGHQVTLIDLNEKTVAAVNSGYLPFREEGADEVLQRSIGKNLKATTDRESLKTTDAVIFVTGTEFEQNQNPEDHKILSVVRDYMPLVNTRALVILCSTLYPGLTQTVHGILSEYVSEVRLAFCPERMIQGKGLEEIAQLPQIISATSALAQEIAYEIFSTIAPKVIFLSPAEAEVAKLMCNAWRYLEFSVANQFYMMAENKGLDFHKILNALSDEYPRAKSFARPGLAAGPCLVKDTLQLTTYSELLPLSTAALQVNQSLPVFLIDQLDKKLDGLQNKTIAILGMTFKANNDDLRNSLSFELRDLLIRKNAKVICSDPYLMDSPQAQPAIAMADGVVLGVPHNEYLSLEIKKPFVDCWGIWKTTKSVSVFNEKQESLEKVIQRSLEP